MAAKGQKLDIRTESPNKLMMQGIVPQAMTASNPPHAAAVADRQPIMKITDRQRHSTEEAED
jgi:hypothetical protein